MQGLSEVTPPVTPEVTPIVRVQNVEKRYGNGTHALQGASLAVAEGEFISLVGPSGCGKSTLLRIIAGLETPSSGTVTVRGGGSLGFVFQDANLLPWRSVRDNAALPLELQGVPRRARYEAAEAVLSLVGLDGFFRAFPGELSGGMQMRVSIARALVTQPRLLLMDEPFGALDEITRQRLNEELLGLQARTGTTVVFVTHNVFEAVYLSSRVVVMSARPGRLIADLAVPEPYPRSAAFRGSSRFAGLVLRVTETLGGSPVPVEAAA